MRIVSVNLGSVRQVPWRGNTVKTGIYKEPVAGPVQVQPLTLAGDVQCDLMVHGGPDKAVYAYPSEHYAYWREQRPGDDLPWGAFGENLSTEGLLESEVCVGDEYRVGSARLVVTQPRMPCFKLGIRFGDHKVIKQFLTSMRPGIYFAVVEPGQLQAGDTIERLSRDAEGLTVVELLQLILDSEAAPERIERALRVPALAEVWRSEFRERLAG